MNYFSVISWREQVAFQWDDGDSRFVTGRHVAPLRQIILIRVNHYLLFLVNTEQISSKYQLYKSLSLTRRGIEPTIYCTLYKSLSLTRRGLEPTIYCTLYKSLSWPVGGSNPQSTALSICLWLNPTGARTTIYRTRGEHANHYTTAIRLGVIHLLFH
jgi:hypothetical protein